MDAVLGFRAAGLGVPVTAKRRADAERACPTPNSHHEPGCPDDYMARQAWFAEMAKTHEQRQCPGCGLWRVWVKREATEVATAALARVKELEAENARLEEEVDALNARLGDLR
jgi:hypothetical protein